MDLPKPLGFDWKEYEKTLIEKHDKAKALKNIK
jgi:hypothetical protein